MSDLYAQLLARTDHLSDVHRALRAVVELHAPEQHYTVDQKNRSHPSRLYCRTCRATAPCSTIRVIADALGVKDQERTEKEQHDG